MSTAVAELQKALRTLAYKAQNSSYDPQKYDGTMDLGTLVALVNATKVVGDAIPYAGHAISAISDIKGYLGDIPYGGKIIEFLLAPWIVDEVFDAILAALGAIKLGSAASSARKAMDTAKKAVETAALPIAGAIALVSKTLPAPLNGPLGAAAPINTSTREVTPTTATAVAPTKTCGHIATDPMVPAPSGCARSWIWAKGDTCCQPGYSLINDPEKARCVAADGNICVPTGTCPSDSYWNATDQHCYKKATTAPTVTTTPGRGPCPTAASSLTKKALSNIRDVNGNCYDPSKQCPTGFAATIYGCARFSADYTVLEPPTKSGVVYPHIHEYYLDVDTDLSGFGPPAHWNADDRKHWENKKDKWKIVWKNGRAHKWNVKDGELPFFEFKWQNRNYGVFYNGSQLLAKPFSYKDVGEIVCDKLEDAWEIVEQYGCALVNSEIAVGIAAGAAGLVASPAASAAVVTGAAAGATACAAIKISEALYLILKVLAHPIKAPNDLSSETYTPPPASGAVPALALVTGATARLKSGNIARAPGTSQALLPLPSTQPSYNDPVAVPGSFQWYNAQEAIWYVARPIGDSAVGLSGPGDATYSIATARNPISGVDIVTQTEGERRTGTLPWYKSGRVWVVVGAAGAVGIATLIVRRQRRRHKGDLRDAHGTILRHEPKRAALRRPGRLCRCPDR